MQLHRTFEIQFVVDALVRLLPAVFHMCPSLPSRSLPLQLGHSLPILPRPTSSGQRLDAPPWGDASFADTASFAAGGNTNPVVSAGVGALVVGAGGSDSSGSERSAVGSAGVLSSSSSSTSGTASSSTVSHDSEATAGLLLRHLTIAAREAVADGGGVPGEWKATGW